MTAEEWLPVPGWEGRYEVSSQGRVRSLPGYHKRGRILAGRRQDSGYRTVSLWSKDRRQTASVHRLVAAAFSRLPRDGEVCRHLNGDRSDNRAVNLAWGTDAENAADTLAMGRHFNASKTRCKKGHHYTAENTYLIREKRGVRRRCRTCHSESRRKAAA